MKTASKKTVAGKATTFAIIGIIFAGTLAIWGIADISEGSGLLTKVFFLFLGAVIVVQIIPALMLLTTMLKAVAGLFGKKAKAGMEETSK